MSYDQKYFMSLSLFFCITTWTYLYRIYSKKSSQIEHKIIIVGAGISGIAAARKLHQVGFNPLILEAKDRIGGRISYEYLYKNLLKGNNDAISRNEKIAVQLGANWIHGLSEDNIIFRTAKKLELNLHVTSSDDEPGSDVLLFDIDENNVFEAISSTEYENLLLRYKWIQDHMSVAGGDNVLLSFKHALNKSVNSFGALTGRDLRCLNWFLDRISIAWALPVCEIPTTVFLDSDDDGLNGEAMITSPCGYQQVVEHLAREYDLDIRFQHEVTKVIENAVDGTVSVHCANGEQFTTSQLLITVPLGVLASNQIDFRPAIPRCISDVIRASRIGLMDIVWLWYPTFFWPRDTTFLGAARDEMQTAQFTTFAAPPLLDASGRPQPVLMCQIVGAFALQAEGMTLQDLAAAATAALQRFFPRIAVPDAIGCLRSSWGGDRFSRGSYSSPSSAAVSAAQRGPVWYAGEAEDPQHTGTVHGAYNSGQRAAEMLLEGCGETHVLLPL